MLNKFGFSIKNLVFFHLLVALLVFQNCSINGSFRLKDTRSTLSNNDGEGGNGGGYNGPNLRFYLIPQIDSSESENPQTMFDKLLKAYVSCQFGDYKRGLTGSAFKFVGIISRYDLAPCFYAPEIRDDFMSLLSKPYNQNNLDLAKPEVRECYLYYSQQYTRVSNLSNLLQMGTTELAPYDSEIDPPEYETDPFWQGYNFKWTLKDYSGQQSHHFSTSGGLSSVWLTRPTVSANSTAIARHRVALLNSSIYKPNLDLYETATKKLSGLTFNQYELLSCVQSEYYFNHSDKTQFQSKNLRVTDGECAVLSDWMQTLTQRKSLLNDKQNMYNSNYELDMSSIEASWMREFNSRKETSQQIFQRFLKGEFSLSQIHACLEKTHNQADFVHTMQTEFFFMSINRLREMNKPYLSTLMDKISDSTNGGVWTIFHVAGVSDKAINKAGVHRLHLSAYMNIADIPPNEWLFTFVHEMVHRLDEQMLAAEERFSGPEKLKSLQNYLSTNSSSSTLTETQIQEWIVDGLQRGIAAEYRAWLLTAKFYEDYIQIHPEHRLQFWEAFLEGHRTFEPDFKCFLMGKLASTNAISDQAEINNEKLRPALQTELQKIKSCDPFYLQELKL